MEFSLAEPSIMHVDINSCFATVEQQANPGLRGRPVAVAAYVEDHGCILAASREAKVLGIKTCMRVREAKMLAPQLVVLPPDPDKYRHTNRALKTLLESYSAYVSVESIDEMVLSLAHTPSLGRRTAKGMPVAEAMMSIACEIKQRITQEVGDWITVSIGIAPNRYLAKVASGLKKPDGLDVITRDTIKPIFSRLKLEDLCGIKSGNANRLRAAGIYNPLMMCEVDAKTLARAFHSVVGYHWWMRLHGWEDGGMYKSFGAHEENQKSFGQSHALGIPAAPSSRELRQILAQLTMKMGRRLRQGGFAATGVGVSTLFIDHTDWRKQEVQGAMVYADNDFYHLTSDMLERAPVKPVRILAVSCFGLASSSTMQQSLFEEGEKKERLTHAIDAVHDRFGEFVLTSGRVIDARQKVLDRIAFGKVRDLDRSTAY
jgi:DNA polymerase IV